MAFYLLLLFPGPALGNNPNVAMVALQQSFFPQIEMPIFHQLWVESYNICQGMSNTSFRKASDVSSIKPILEEIPAYLNHDSDKKFPGTDP